MNDPEQSLKAGYGATSNKADKIGIWSSHMGVALQLILSFGYFRPKQVYDQSIYGKPRW